MASLLVYANAGVNGFVLDDRGIILQNTLVQEPGTAWRAFLSPYWPADVGGGQYRPLGILSFALDHALAGNNATWFHLVNVAWHAAAAALLALLGVQLGGAAVGTVAGLLFAIHPVHVEAVANVVGRLELMAASFGLATLLLHRRRSAWAWVTFAAALGSKEGAVVVPLLAALVDRIPGGDTRRARPLFLGYAAVAVAWGSSMAFALRDATLSTKSAVFVGLPIGDRLLTVVSIVPHYVRLLLVPAQLSADYEPGVLEAARTITPMVLAGAFLVALAGWGLYRAWRRAPLLAVAIGWSIVAIGPVSNVVVVTGVALAERTLYLASAGVALGLAWLAMHPATPGVASRVVIALLLLAGAARTWTRTPTWRDSRTFALQLLEDHPESYHGHWVAARVLRAAGDMPAAAREYMVAHSIYAGDLSMLREATEVAQLVGDGVGATRFRAAADSLVIARAR
ncbi:MAG: hypothetical protein JNJ98_17780 [Gemmatimonadetes bacterium]|nr:hypothetical protein [Gemmatimonadota bacterium]